MPRFSPTALAAMKKSMLEIWEAHAKVLQAQNEKVASFIPSTTKEKPVEPAKVEAPAETQAAAPDVEVIVEKPLPVVEPVAEKPLPVVKSVGEEKKAIMISRISKKTKRGLPYTIPPTYNKCWFVAVAELVEENRVVKKTDGYYVVA